MTMTENRPQPKNPPQPEAPSLSSERPTLDELRERTDALGDVITEHFKLLEGR